MTLLEITGERGGYIALGLSTLGASADGVTLKYLADWTQYEGLPDGRAIKSFTRQPDIIDFADYFDCPKNGGFPPEVRTDVNAADIAEILVAAYELYTDEGERLMCFAPIERVKVSCAWSIPDLKTHWVLELLERKPSGSKILVLMRIDQKTPMTVLDFEPYEGEHPRKLRGEPMPQIMYAHYGLTRDSENLSELIHVNVSPSDKQLINARAREQGKSPAQYMREKLLAED